MTLLSILWAIAFGICPQRPSHSLFFGGQQMPIEARMGGIFAGFVIGAAVIGLSGRARTWRLPGRGMSALLLTFVGSMGLDGFNAFLFDLRLPHLYTPLLPLRLATGLLAGLAAAAYVVPAFNETVWAQAQDSGALHGVRPLLAALGLEAAYLGLGLSGAPALLYPLSLVAVLGVPLLLGTVGTIVVAIATRRSQQAVRWSDVVPLVIGGLALAALFLAIASAGRYALFGPGPLELRGAP